MGVVVEQRVTLPHPDLPSADWADSYCVRLDRNDLVPMEVATELIGRAPRWVGLCSRSAIVLSVSSD